MIRRDDASSRTVTAAVALASALALLVGLATLLAGRSPGAARPDDPAGAEAVAPQPIASQPVGSRPNGDAAAAHAGDAGIGAPQITGAAAGPDVEAELTARAAELAAREARADLAEREARLAERERALAARETSLDEPESALDHVPFDEPPNADVDARFDGSDRGGWGEPASRAPAWDAPPEPRHFPRRSPRTADAPASRPVAVVLPAGTEIDVRLASAVSSDESLAGDELLATVAADVVRDGVVALPAGAGLSGRVVEVRPARSIGGRSRVVLDFDRLVLPGAPPQPLRATAVIEGKPQAKKDAATIGGATAGGALLGRILKRDDEARGTLIGAVVGAAVGSAVAARNAADPVVLAPGTVLPVVLEAPFEPQGRVQALAR